MAKRTLDPMTEVPSKKSELTKPFMLAYLRSAKATKEDVIWYREFVNNPDNRKENTNHLDGSTYNDIDITKVREAFGKKFYPFLYEERKNKKKKSFEEEIDDILSIK